MSKSGFSHEPPTGTAGTVEWYTPAWIFEALGLKFDLDPCSPPGGLPWLPAARHHSLPVDGLAAPWQGRVWCNPPYGAETARWLAKMNQHRNGVALVFARTDVGWFRESVAPADAVLFLEGRIQFVDKTGEPPRVFDAKTGKWKKSGPGAGSMLIAWGGACAQALLRMRHQGLLVDLSTNRKVLALRTESGNA